MHENATIVAIRHIVCGPAGAGLRISPVARRLLCNADMANWRSTWWDESRMSTWDRVKEALRRDWEQTKHDVGMKSGHYLHQDVADTVNQAAGTERIPPPGSPNPPRVVASWSEVELAMSYGFSARAKTGASPAWNPEVEAALRLGWEGGVDHPTASWEDMRVYVRQGYEAATS